MTQRCGRCKNAKPVEDFSPSYRGKPGTWCRACFRDYTKGDRGPSAAYSPVKCEICGETYTPKQAQKRPTCSRRCREVDRAQSGRQRNSHLLRKYGITSADYDHMLTEQDGHCALCPATPETLTVGRYRTFLHVDHDHDTGKVRGLLCPDCNLMIGRRGPDWFARVVTYLAG